MTTEWMMAQTDSADQLAQLHLFSVKKRQADREIEFKITVREYAEPQDSRGRFYAQADKQTNQKTVPYTPCGWGSTLLKALAECLEAIQRFPYEGEETR